jgi:dihydrofolate reductase
MGKIILFNLVSLDGFIARPDGNIDWHNVDEEFNDFAIEQLNLAGGLIFGRVTYQLMASYWPTPAGKNDDPIVAEKMNTLPKYVFSRTLKNVEWNHTRLVQGDTLEEISKLKQQPGKDLFVFGSADLASTLIQQGFIDEYRMLVNPVILGSGIPYFKGVQNPLKLKLLNTRVFRSGNVLLFYAPGGANPGKESKDA